jgi:hypothetical protein
LFSRDGSASARNPDNLANDLTFLDWRVNRDERVSLRDHSASRQRLNSMGYKSSVFAIEDNLPWMQIGQGAMLDGKNITGPDSRQHTCPGDAQAGFANRARDITN